MPPCWRRTTKRFYVGSPSKVTRLYWSVGSSDLKIHQYQISSLQSFPTLATLGASIIIHKIEVLCRPVAFLFVLVSEDESEGGIAMKAAHTVLVALTLMCIGCATPPEVKQALIAKDQAYAENARLMELHRELLVNIDERYRYWYQYTKQLALLNLALKWATTDPGPADESGRGALVSATIKEFGTDQDMRSALITAINHMRLKDLPERKDKQGAIVFEKGRGDMGSLIREIPTLINVIHTHVEAERKLDEKTRPTDYSGFDDYQTNLASLRRINEMVKRYLDIDVTIDRADIRQLSESVKVLR